STGLPEGLSQELSMTRRRQTKQTGVLAYPHFLFAVVTQATDARGCDARDVATARRDDRPHAEVTRAQFYRCINPIRRGDREPVNGNAFPPSLTLFLLACAARQSVVREKRIRTTLLWQLGDSASPSSR